MPKIDQIDRRTDVVFLLFRYAETIGGVTKLQKLLFLVEKETEFFNTYEDVVSFNFAPYKMGPFSENVYTEVQFLREMKAIETEPMKSKFGTEYDDSLSNKRFTITEKGMKIATELETILEPKYRYELSELIEEYNSMDLRELLEYVYKEYPEFAEKSEIKDQVMGTV